MSNKCAKCSREKETPLLGSPSKNCYLCIGEAIHLTAILESLDLSGLKTLDRNCRCCICSRDLVRDQEAIASDYGYVCHSCIGFYQRDLKLPINLVLAEQKVWLVKTSLKIQGPYNEQRIVMGIRNREFSAIDELCQPRRFWKYLRDLEEFRFVLKEAQSISESRELPTVDITRSMTGSGFATDPKISRGQQGAVVDVAAKDLHSLSSRTWRERWFSRPQVGWLLGATLLAWGIYYAPSLYQKRQGPIGVMAKQDLQNLEQLYNQGQYFELQQAAQAKRNNGFPLDEREEALLAYSYLATKDYFVAESMLDRLSKPEQIQDRQILAANLAFFQGREEAALQEMLSTSEKPIATEIYQLNLAFLQSLQGKASQALKTIPRQVNLEALNSARLLGKLFAELYAGTRLSERELYQRDFEAKDYVDSSISLKILLGLHQYRSGLSKKGRMNLLTALGQHPDSEREFVQDPALLVHAAKYAALSQWLQTNEIELEGIKPLLQAALYYHQNKISAARQSLDSVDNETQHSDLLTAWRNLLEGKRDYSIPTHVDPTFLRGQGTLQLRFIADHCLETRRFKCAETIYKHLLQSGSRDLYSVRRLVELYLEQGDLDSAKALLRQNLATAPRYKVFMEWEKQLL